MSEPCRSLRCNRAGSHAKDQCPKPLPVPDPVTQAIRAIDPLWRFREV